MYLAATIGITAVLAMGTAYTTVTSGSGSSSDPVGLVEAVAHNDTGTWQTVLMKDGKECEGLVFESSEDAERAALGIGCTGYHEHRQEDGSILYMPCSAELRNNKADEKLGRGVNNKGGDY